MNEQILNKKDTYIIGVSGGVDSMCLLDMLRIKKYSIIVCHVNYHFRHDSDIDQENVETYCMKYEIPCFVYNVDPSEFGKMNFQEQARIVRYHFYETIGSQFQTKKVILGHHYDDVLETIIMQQDRGNIYSYQGIKEITQIAGLDVYRPLLETRKVDLYEYCQNNNVIYHEDYTNFETHFTRDKVRNMYIPTLSKEETESILLEATKRNHQLLKREAKAKPFYDKYKEQGYINYHEIVEVFDTVLYLMLKDYIYPPKISKKLIDEIRKQIESNKPNIEVSISVNVLFIKEYDNITIIFKKEQLDYCLKYDKIVYAREEMFSLELTGHIDEGIYIQDSDLPITIRNVLPGDTILTSGGTKKVSRLFIDRKVPKDKRISWPVVVRSDGIILLVPRLAKNIDYLYTKPNVYVVKLDY